MVKDAWEGEKSVCKLGMNCLGINGSLHAIHDDASGHGVWVVQPLSEDCGYCGDGRHVSVGE